MLSLLIDAIIKENVNGALFVIIKSICFCNFVGFHKSSASKKDMYLPPALLIPLFLATPVPQFFQAEKMYSIIFSTISKIIATVLSDEQSSTKISSQFS
jgi:hypothetical protein